MSKDRKELTARGSFNHWSLETIRYGDMDPQRHVNNVAFASFSETGRTHLLRAVRPAPVGCHYVIAKLVIQFRQEITWPGTIDIGTNVLAIGRTSFTLGQGFFVGEACFATAENVLVLADSESRRPTPLPDDLRQRLAQFVPAEPPGKGV